mmetsp:Transcript_29973/g.80142  ORF Transcript_29973/g.80142 Transcript_29973/m.80142 type:complete len:172 (+) Transcript_29973:128-643(+)
MVEKLIHYIAGYIKGALAVTYKEVVSSESRFGTFKSDTEEKIYKIVYKIIEEEEQKRRHAELVAQMSGNCAATSHNAQEVAGHRGDAHAHDLASAGHAAEHTTAAFEHSFGVCLKRNLSTSILTDLVMPFPQTQAAVCLWVVDKLLEDCKLEKLDDAMIHLKEARHEKKGA